MERPGKEGSKVTENRYNRIARIYDLSEYLVERLLYRRWRKRLWNRGVTAAALSSFWSTCISTGRC